MGVNMKTARIAGFLYLTIFVAGIFAEFVVRQSIIVPGDTQATVSNLMASEQLFRMGIAADLVMIISDVALALVFFVLLKPVNSALSLLAAFFRLTQAAILGLNLLNLFIALMLMGGADLAAGVGAEQLHSQIMLFLGAHGVGYSLGLVFFGANCFIFGYLVFKSGYFPKVLGALLVIAGAVYLADGFAKVLMADYAAYQSFFDMTVVPLTVTGELAMCLWLLVKGVNVSRVPDNAALPVTQAEELVA